MDYIDLKSHEPIAVDEHYNCRECGCSHLKYIEALNCCNETETIDIQGTKGLKSKESINNRRMMIKHYSKLFLMNNFNFFCTYKLNVKEIDQETKRHKNLYDFFLFNDKKAMFINLIHSNSDRPFKLSKLDFHSPSNIKKYLVHRKNIGTNRLLDRYYEFKNNKYKEIELKDMFK